MAAEDYVTTVADVKIYQEQFFGGMTEILQQAADVFNAKSNGAIAMTTAAKKGDYEQESFFKALNTIVARQDIADADAVTSLKLTQDENVRVKLHRRIGPLDVTRKAFLMMGADPKIASFIFGQQTAQAVAEEMVNTALLAARVALANQSAVTTDVTSADVKTCSHANLLKALSKFGDKSQRIVAWVMHSQNFFDLALNGLEDDVTGIANEIIRVVNVPGLGRPIIITDSPSLVVTGDTPDSYYVLGLQAGGIQVVQSENQYITSQEQLGLQQLTSRIQGEYAYNLGVAGFKWDMGNGGVNPDAAAVATAAYWDKVATSSKDLAGVVLKCNPSA